MYSGQPPLKIQGIAHGGGSHHGDSLALQIPKQGVAALKGGLATSENCDPNLANDKKVARKAESRLDSAEECSSIRTTSVSLLRKPETLGARDATLDGASEAEKLSKEVSRTAKTIPSPTASPSPHQQGHRQHFCRSPRCASNNPDYAVRALSTPRKYLISKRHLLPGAICTRDPATLEKHAQDSIITPTSNSKPPKPSRSNKAENGFLRQPSFSDASDLTSPSPSRHPPTRIPKPPSSACREFSSPGVHPSSSPLQPCSARDEAAARFPSNLQSFEQCAPVASFQEEETQQPRPVETLTDSTDHKSDVDSVPPPPSLEVSVEANQGTEPSIVPAERELSSLEKMFLPNFDSLSDSIKSRHSSISVSPSLDLQVVSEELSQKLALEKEENDAQQLGTLWGEVARQDVHAEAKEAGIATTDVHTEAKDAGNASVAIEVPQIMQAEAAGAVVPVSGDIGDEDASVVQVGSSSSEAAESLDDSQGQKPRSIASFIENYENCQTPGSDGRGVQKFVRGKGRQLWRSDCRDSREVVFLKPTSPSSRRAGDWMVDNILEGAISKLNPSGHGRVRVLVEAFESLMNLGDANMPERRASRVWCLNRMEKGEVDEDGEEFEEGDQRVDCYEVSGDGLQLRASMRLSLGGAGRLPLCDPDEASEIELSAIEKVQDWDDCQQSTSPPSSFKDQAYGCIRFQSSFERTAMDQDGSRESGSEDGELTLEEYQMRMSAVGDASEWQTKAHRLAEDLNGELGCSAGESVEQRINGDAARRRRFWKSSSLKSESDVTSSSFGGSLEKNLIRGTMLEPFHLLTEERGAMKEYQFAKKLEHMFAEEERRRNPIAQGLPWTTTEPQVVPKPAVKEQTRPVEFRHYSNSRAIERAEFDQYINDRIAYAELQRQEEERLRLIAEQEDVKRLRREMVPRAQLMPFFDQPFIPTRSSKRLTVPKEPSFRNREFKRAKCMIWHEHL